MNFLTNVLSEADGSPSCTRVIAMIASLAVVGLWVITSYKSGVLAPVSVEQLGLALGPLGFKVLQKGKETPAPSAPTA